MTQTTSFCPNCKSRNLEEIDHEAADHPLIEIHRKQLIQYRCKECGKTFYNRREDFDIVKYTTDLNEYWEEKRKKTLVFTFIGESEELLDTLTASTNGLGGSELSSL